MPLVIQDRNVHGMDAKVMVGHDPNAVLALAALAFEVDVNDAGRRQQVFPVQRRRLPHKIHQLSL
jgi:hypothetical protein